MKPLKEFEYFLEKGVVKKKSADKSRSDFLRKEAGVSFEGLTERVDVMGINEKNANSIIKDCYDIILEIIRSKMFLLGYFASGVGAHEAEVSFSRKLLKSENDVQFLNKLRHFRNGTIYYGTMLDLEYARQIFDFTLRIYDELIDSKGF